jgi:hypothetical protein
MRIWILFASIVLAGLVLAAYNLLAGPSSPDVAAVSRFMVLNAKGLSVVGALIAVAQYSKGDYLRTAWALLALGGAALINADLIELLVVPAMPGTVATVALDLFVLASNVATPLAMLYFARALAASGLDLVGDRRTRVVVTVVVGLATAALAGRATVGDLRLVLGGNFSRIDYLFSELGDVAAMVLLAPLLYNVFSLRGGALSWPFLMLASSNVGWLLFDGIDATLSMTGAPQSAFGQSAQMATRIWALLFLFGAGLVQSWLTARDVSPAQVEDLAAAA